MLTGKKMTLKNDLKKNRPPFSLSLSPSGWRVDRVALLFDYVRFMQGGGSGSGKGGGGGGSCVRGSGGG